MLIYSLASLIPLLVTTGLYFLLKLFLFPQPAWLVALCAGTVASAAAQFFGMKPNVFYLPLGFWFGLLSGYSAFNSYADTGVETYIIFGVTALFALAGTVMWVRSTFMKSGTDGKKITGS